MRYFEQLNQAIEDNIQRAAVYNSASSGFAACDGIKTVVYNGLFHLSN